MADFDAATLTASLRRLATQGRTGDLLPTLQSVVDGCVDLFRVTGSGIMLIDAQNTSHYVASSDGAGRLLETAESQFGEGPCTEALVSNALVDTSDLRADPRWPRLAAAVASEDVRAVLGIPVRLSGAPVGTLDAYLDRPHEWSDTERSALERYGELIGLALGSALAAHRAGELADQLQYALDYRVSIERGVGYLMARDGIDAVAAFNRLRTAARSSRTRIGTVAEELLATGRLPSAQSK